MTAMRKYRKALGLSQLDVAKQLGVSPNAVSMWETGERKPDIIMLKKLTSILHCTADQLLEPIEV